MKKRSKKIKTVYFSAIFLWSFLNSMQLALLKQHAVFNGIPVRKMAAEAYKVVLTRLIADLYRPLCSPWIGCWGVIAQSLP